MKIFVCIKQVPDTETKIKVAADSKGIETASIKWIVNPYDEYAIEEAVRLKETHAGSTVTVFTVGPKKRVGEVLRTALAMGADEGVIIDSPEWIDPLLAATALAAAIKQEGVFDLLLTGKAAIDDNASSVGPMLAQLLSISHASVVSKLSVSPEYVVAEREVEGGTKEIVQMKMPALIAATKGLNSPRYASLPGIMKAKKKVLKELDFAGLGVQSSATTNLSNYRLPAEKPAAKLLGGAIDQQISELVRLLRDEAKAL
jgi:electron transfer flavoprotein beta subunit